MINDLEEVLYQCVVVPSVAFLPAPFAYGAARRRGDWRYKHDVTRRNRIMRNLEGVLGDQLSLAERGRVTRDFFRRRSCQAIDEMRLAAKGRALTPLVEIRGLEYLEAALNAGKGAILCSAHFGNFHAMFSLLAARGYEVTNVGDLRSTYDASLSPLRRSVWRVVERRATRHRRPNIEPTRERSRTAVRVTEALQSNEVIAIALDSPDRLEDNALAVSVDFLGRQIRLMPGIVNIARLTDSPVLTMVALRRLPDWQHQVVEISPPVPLTGDTAEAFRRCWAMVEAPIRQNLGYWDWWGGTQYLINFGLLPQDVQVDEAEIMLPMASRHYNEVPSTAPRTTLEQRLADIVAAALGLEQVGVHDNFFLLGGQSLQMLQLLAQVRETFDIDLPLQTLTHAPTVVQLAPEVEQLILARLEELSDDEALRLLG